MTQPLPTLGPVIADTGAVAAALGLQPGDLSGRDLPVEIASSGLPFVYVALKSRAAVDAAALDRAKLCALLRAVHLEEHPVFLFSLETANDGATVYSRMFAPGLGIPEDPGTGSATGPLGAYLLKYNAVPAKTESRLVSLQGVRMGRPSRLHIALTSGAGVLKEVQVGGEAVVVGEGTLRG
jgi:trans-2,3-dihydro-3-hydroxyanthranilate isomerase